jgi:hydroxymethylpyrimidine/phosphomethylpyrimidine kinase
VTAENAQRSTSNVQRSIPVALTIAGSDSSSGAGIQADLKTFTAMGVYGLTAVTCVVAEIPGKVSRIEPMPPEIVRDQIEVVAKSFPLAAIKTGLLCSAGIVAQVAETIAAVAGKVPVIVDPVMVATSGAQLLDPKAVEVYERELFPRATLLTPNLDEAAKLLGKEIRDRDAMSDAAKSLAAKYGTAVLLKGGHLAGEAALDLLCVNGQIREFSSEFVRGVQTHGTGCTYSAAITAGLATGLQLEDSIRRAKDFVTRAIQTHFRWGEIHALKLQ